MMGWGSSGGGGPYATLQEEIQTLTEDGAEIVGQDWTTALEAAIVTSGGSVLKARGALIIASLNSGAQARVVLDGGPYTDTELVCSCIMFGAMASVFPVGANQELPQFDSATEIRVRVQLRTDGPANTVIPGAASYLEASERPTV